MSKRPLAGSICGLATTLIIGGLCGAPAQAQTDTTPPSVSVTSATTSSPPSGNASDAGGIQKVLLTLVKLTTDGTSSVFWTGPFTGWMASTTSLNATLSAPDANGQVTWTWPSTTGLPTYGTGRYTLKATAYDNANNTSSSSVNFFSGGDTTVPTVGFSTSMSGDNATTDHLIVPTGDASDAGGIRYVRITLSRADETGTTYWNGLLGNASQWVSTQTFLPASVTDKAGTSGRTSVDWQIPGVTWPDNPNLTAGNQLPPGIYTWRIYANDFSENSANASLTLRITPTDSVSPTVSFAPPGPVNGSLVDGTYQTGWNGVVTGTSQDPNDNPTTPGSGVIRVTVTLTRNFTGTTEYLTSAGGWTTASTPVYADVQNPDATGAQAWTASFSGVALNGLARGSYVLKATAQDRYGNSSTASATINVTPPDSTAPTISVTTPASGANLSRLTAISGTATDNSGGSGITRAYVQLSHVFSGVKQYWTGTAWTTTATNLPVQLSSSPSVTFNWNISSGLPSGTNLPSGTSTVKAWCFDAYGNQSASVTQNFNVVTNTAPAAAAQTVLTPYNNPLNITLSAPDAEGDAVTYAVVTQPAHGTLSGTVPNLIYTPNTGFSGSDSFTFTGSDYALTGAAATVSISVGAPPLDLMVQNDSGVWLGNGLLSGDATGQTVSSVGRSGKTLHYTFKLEAHGTSEQESAGDALDFVLYGQTVPDGWAVHYTLDGAEVTTGALSEAGQQSTLAYGTSAELVVDVTCPANLTSPVNASILIRVVPIDQNGEDETSLTDAGAVQVQALPSVQPDLSFQQVAESPFIPTDTSIVGSGQFNSDPSQQVLSLCSPGTQESVSVILKNTGSAVATYRMKGLSQVNAWNATYTDSKDGTDITLAIVSGAWQVTLNPGELRKLIMTVPQTTQDNNTEAPFTFNVQAGSAVGDTWIPDSPLEASDAGTVRVFAQTIESVDYSIDGGQSWQPFAGELTVQKDDVVGFRANKKIAGADWRYGPVYQPIWSHGDKEPSGDIVWLQYKTVGQQSVRVGCGNSFTGTITVLPESP